MMQRVWELPPNALQQRTVVCENWYWEVLSAATLTENPTNEQLSQLVTLVEVLHQQGRVVLWVGVLIDVHTEQSDSATAGGVVGRADVGPENRGSGVAEGFW